MNCWTNSIPYGNGGDRADVIVLPVRIIMSPTCSSRPLAGRNTRSAAALTNSLDPPLRGHRPLRNASRGKPTACTAQVPGGTELRLGAVGPWYLAPALEARRVAVACVLAGLALGGCSSTKEQNENEPAGNFQVRIVSADFPARQKLAKSSRLVIRVRNDDTRTVPNIAMTIDGLEKRKRNPQLANPERPQFVINGKPQTIGGVPESKEQAPVGCETVYVNTWACGRLKPGAQKTFVWNVTAVGAGAPKGADRGAARPRGEAEAGAGRGGGPLG